MEHFIEDIRMKQAACITLFMKVFHLHILIKSAKKKPKENVYGMADDMYYVLLCNKKYLHLHCTTVHCMNTYIHTYYISNSVTVNFYSKLIRIVLK